MNRSTSITAALAAVLVAAAPAAAQSSAPASGLAEARTAASVSPAPTADIVETAAAAGTFKTLLAAARAAGPVETLKASGPMTVFAPTDEAFARLPAGTVEELLKPANRERLRAILTYHVVPGLHTAKDVLGSVTLPTAYGEPVHIYVHGGVPKVEDARITGTDIMATNGVIHVIDAVLLPPEKEAPASSN